MTTSVASRLGGSLPIPRTRLIGRESERAMARALLLDDAVPLLTLTGPGGVGKTRLALAIAQDVAPEFAEGAVFIDLSSLADPELVAATVAATMEVMAGPDRSLTEAIAAHLRTEQRLLILDNCEHLLAAVAALVAALLASCPAVQVLATSRAALQVQGEQILPVLPLAVPETGAGHLERVQDAPAVRLFVQRARAADPHFALTEQNVAAVAEICQRLDGLPLAIELAAARIQILSPEALRSQLTGRLTLLTSGPRDAPARQRTMRDAIAWGHSLLAPREQTVFRRLAVFSSGCTLEDAGAVANPVAEAELDTLAGISSLADHSLLRRQEGPDGASRYVMLETVREFGLERLAASGEEPSVRRAHADRMIACCEEAWTAIVIRLESGWLARLDAERDNVRSALGFLERVGDGEGLLRLAGAADPLWNYRSYRAEGRVWLERALEHTRETAVPPAVRIRALRAAGFLARNQGDHPRAIAHGQECLALARAANHQEGAAVSHHLLGYVASAEGAYEQAREHFEEELRLETALGDRADMASAWLELGRVRYGQGDYEHATALLEQALTVQRDVDDRWGMALSLNSLGLVDSLREQRKSAAERLREALPLWRAFDNKENLAEWLATVATLAAASQAPPRAARLFGAAEALRAEVGHVFVLPDAHVFGEAEQAIRVQLGVGAFQAEHAAGRSLPLDHALEEAVAFLSGAPAASNAAARDGVPSPSADPFTLTRREQEIFSLLCQRLSDPEIAAQLFLSPRTVESHVSRILGKLGAANRREAAAIAARHALV
jgi:predicted ATPase/DNA-binding CsgD family transcriptional regulator/Tfp pilus assembly protein PilF